MAGITGFVWQCFLFLTGATLVWSQTFTYNPFSLSWRSAKQFCECTGHLVIIDTMQKQMALLNQVTVSAGECVWIGASTLNNNQQHRWIEVPPNYGLSWTNGELLSNTHSNFLSGVPESGGELNGVCIFNNGTWMDVYFNYNLKFICEWRACGPGQYKGKEPSNNVYCTAGSNGQRDTCLKCPGQTIKTSSGDSVSLCDIDCGGVSKVANTEHTACECNAGYYGNGSDTCTPCPGNTIKSTRGDAPDCNVEIPCDGVTIEPNTEHTACVCKAGYFRGIYSKGCLMCTGNKIKKTSGNEPNCDADIPCDGVMTAPNMNHTACVCNSGHYKNGDTCVLCNGDEIKATPGNDTACSATCNGSSDVPNAGHTACECNAGYYRINGICTICSGNTIKTMTGDAAHCDADAACDGLKIPNAGHTACVCIHGYYMSGPTCLSCLSFISGFGGEVLIDGDTNTCAAVPVPKIEGAVPQYQLSINGNCTSNLNLMVTMEPSASCDDLRSVLFTEKPRSGCSDVNNHFSVCDVTNEIQSGEQKRCSMKCKCAESANQCVLHIISGLIRKTVNICEIVKY